ncbi:OB-fold domain-containing protein [Paucibacter sp. O1-1]|nr:OB-fold domain-containing protein [Paucibacter sp. O1-1]MDA3825060.1 OB-fold domain-containing protein [Paucibacter sp. O1-1]
MIGPEKQYFDFLHGGTLKLQQCRQCSRFAFPPRGHCVHCDSADLQWAAPSGFGSVYSHTTIGRKPESGGDYSVVLVDLAEGVRMMSTVVGIAPREVQVGQNVKASVVLTDGVGKVVFERV